MKLIWVLIVVLMTQLIASAALKPDSGINDTLDALHEVGKDLKSFSANVTLHETDLISQDSSSRVGMAVYEKQASGDSRFRVTFLKRVQDGLTEDQRIEYLLENGILFDRNYPRKLEVKRQLVKPGEAKKINLLKLGEGPFPLPIGQPREDVLRLFEVEKIALEKNDPQNAIHLRLTPKPNTEFQRKFKTIDVWVDATNGMPRRVDTVDANDTFRRGTDLSDLRLNVPLTDEHFRLSELPADWQLREEAYDE